MASGDATATDRGRDAAGASVTGGNDGGHPERAHGDRGASAGAGPEGGAVEGRVVAAHDGAGPTGVVDRAATVLGRTPSPFTPRQLARLDEALTMSSRETGIQFSVYIGALEEPTREHTERLHPRLGAKAANSVLIAVSPGQRVVHIVTGETSSRRLPARSCALAVLSMEAAFSGGDLVGGLVNGLRMLSDQAGRPPQTR